MDHNEEIMSNITFSQKFSLWNQGSSHCEADFDILIPIKVNTTYIAEIISIEVGIAIKVEKQIA